jgi:hypothetical protein
MGDIMPKLNKKSSQKTLVGFALFAVVILIASGVFVYYEYFEEEKEIEEVEVSEERIKDDRVSPLEQQAVFLEINRIRKKGVESLLRQRGNAWKEKPNYRYEAILNDEGLWISKNINEWDTDYVGWEAFRLVEEEQDTCNVEIKIIETKKKLFKTFDDEVLSLKLKYDFKTGRWTGDDNFNDHDGYGHYNGDDYEIWFEVRNSDYDGDNIPYWTEVNVLDTDPMVDDSKLDPDQDGIDTYWEWKWGYDPFVYDNHSEIDPEVDGLSNLIEYEYEKYLLNPFYQDILIEVDFMEKSGPRDLDHILHEEPKQVAMDLFSNHEITLHVDDGIMDGGGEFFEFYEPYIEQESGLASEYYKYHFDDDRKGVFRYMIVANSCGWCHPQDSKLRYDCMAIPTNHRHYRKVYMPPAITTRHKRLAQAAAFMHELGHSLGLMPAYSEGVDNYTQVGRNNLPPLQKYKAMYEANQYWINYESIMNYHKYGQYVLDYSDGSHGIRDSDDWGYIDLTYFQRPKPEANEGIEREVEDLLLLEQTPLFSNIVRRIN